MRILKNQSECTCLHKTVNMVVFYVKSYEKRRTLMQMYRGVPIIKRGSKSA